MSFQERKEAIAAFFAEPSFFGAKLSQEEMEARLYSLEQSGLPRAIVKAESFRCLAENAAIAIDPNDIFQEKLQGFSLIRRQRVRWEKEILENEMKEESEWNLLSKSLGACHANSDYSHTSPNSRLLLQIGLVGLIERVKRAAARDNLSEEQAVFYRSCEITLGAVVHVIERLADAIEPHNAENAAALRAITKRAPQNSYEAMQLLVVMFFLHNDVFATRIRTLGRLDVLLSEFYHRDLAKGRFTKEELCDQLRFFLYHFWCAKIPFDLPFCLGGSDENGVEITDDFSALVVEIYDSLSIYSPKIHIRVSEHTPDAFLKQVLNCIRGGNSSFVFVQEKVAIEGLLRVGVEETDAKNFVPIGCYEPAVWGMEIGCTGCGGVNLAKAVELVFTKGCDAATGKAISFAPEKIATWEDFCREIRRQIVFLTDRVSEYVTKIEHFYDRTNPEPLLSAQYDHSIEIGLDVYRGGAKYNNSSLYFNSLANLVDSLIAVRTLVFEEKSLTLDELSAILMRNWEGNELLRRRVLSLPKYGNHHPEADALTAEWTDFCQGLVNNRPNGRGGVFKASLISIDRAAYNGARTMATPDGRGAGEILSKNLSPTVGCEREGITALIQSVCTIDHAAFPNGSVLDVVLHPSAVQNEEGLTVFLALLKTYFALGGFAMHGNVFSADDLIRAQENPEKYADLQVRVCGWNAFFVDLDRVWQDAFIRQAKQAEETA